jgi:hypothetical protein
MNEHPDRLLIVFGKLESINGSSLPAEEILRKLLNSAVWLAARVPARLALPARAAFYMSGAGVVATALVVEALPTRNINPLPGLPISLFPITLRLTDITLFDSPLDIRQHVDRLSFVKNKTYWGHALRYSPRLINRADFDIITGVDVAR